MTPKEKAKLLINKYLQFYDGRVNIAKQCALFAVDEILKIGSIIVDYNAYDYWNKVKQEINKL